MTNKYNIILFLLFLAVSNMAQTNLVTNPGFEDSVNVGWWLNTWGGAVGTLSNETGNNVILGNISAKVVVTEVGDKIEKVGKHILQLLPKVSYTTRLKNQLSQCTKKSLTLTIFRNNNEKTFLLPKQSKKEQCFAGLQVQEPTVQILVASILAKSTAAKIGLRAGDRIIALNNNNIHGIEQLISSLRVRIYRPIKLTLLRASKKVVITAPIAEDETKWKLGFRPIKDSTLEKQGFGSAAKLALQQTWRFNFLIWNGLKRIFTGQQKAELTGPVGIVNQTQQAVRLGFNYFLHFVAIISIHLAFFNLLPIPALDGGRLMFLFTQQIIRLIGLKDEIGIKIETVANIISFVLLFGLLILITFNDIYKLLFG